MPFDRAETAARDDLHRQMSIAAASSELKVVIVGSNRLELVGMQALLEDSSENTVHMILCDENAPPDIDSFIERNVICLDFDSPGLEPERVTQAVKGRFAETAVVWMSRDQTDRGKFLAIRAGADGFANKARVTDISDAFLAVADDDYHFSPDVLMRYIKHVQLLAPHHPGRSRSLSARENEVLDQVQSGATNKQIAIALSISAETVKVHLRHIRKALGLNSRDC